MAIIILDMSSIIYKSYYSLINMKNSEKEPTGAIYGTLNYILMLYDKFKPEYICACFDVKRSTLKRKEEFSDYKENRDEVPNDLLKQLHNIEELIEILNIKKFKYEGYEADDIIGTLAKKFENSGKKIYIITGDKDLSQLVSENINIALPNKDEFKLIASEENVIEQLGVPPEKVPDLFGLMGDSSDGIPGVKNIGKVKAVKLIKEYGNLESIYENIDKIEGTLKKDLINGKELAFLSKKLATLNTSIQIDLILDDIKVKPFNNEKLLKFLEKMEFRSIIKKLNLTNVVKPMTLFEFSNQESKSFDNEKENISNFEYIVVDNYQKLKNLENVNAISIYSLKSGIAVCDGIKSYYIPVNHNYLEANNIDIQPFYKIVNNIKNIVAYDYKKILSDGFDIKNCDFDVMIANHLLNSGENYSLENIIFSKLKINTENEKEFIKRKLKNIKKTKSDVDEKSINISEIASFICEKSFYLFKLRTILEKELVENELYEIFKNVEMPLIKVLYKMEQSGIKIDTDYLLKYGIELNKKIENLKYKIYEECGEEFNIDSPKQLSSILFDKLKIEHSKKNKTGYSTDVEVLEEIAQKGYKIGDLLLDYRGIVKLKNTYVDTLPKMVDSNSRIHTSFHQDGTATGRLSSSNPNLQNIPIKTDDGAKIRRAFIAEKGNKLISFDYSQIELRVLAELSKDTTLIEAYKKGLDLHAITASKIFEKSIDEITKEERIIAKIVNFSIIYGKSPFGLSKEIKISQKDAKDYINRYFEKYSKVKDFISETIKFAEKNGFVKTYFGYKRYIQGINDRNRIIKGAAERMAVNTVVQGTAADIIKRVMLVINQKIENQKDIKMLLQVHDELVFEVNSEKAYEYGELIKNLMENSIKFENVKLEVNYKIGDNWEELK